MAAWTQYNPTRIFFGAGEAENIGSILRQGGHQRVLLIADPFMASSGKAAALVDNADGIIVGVYDGVDPNPDIHNVNGAIQMANRLGVDGIAALGGGSALDTAKAAAAGVGSKLSAEELVTGSAVDKALPVIAVPTTAGTGSEVTPVSIISWHEKDLKFPLGSPLLFPSIAIVDSTYVYTAPSSVIATSGIDVIAHCLDAISSVRATPLSDNNAIYGASLAFANLERAVHEKDPQAIDAMMLASTVAGLAFSQTGTTGSHAASYYLTSKYGVPHGEATAFTEDAWIRVNAEARPEIHDLVRRMDFDDADHAADSLNTLKRSINLRTTLEEINVPVEDLDVVAQRTLEANNWVNNVARLSKEEIKELFLSKSASAQG